MRIGLVAQSCDARTGIGRVVNSLGRQFTEYGHDVVCASQHFEQVDDRIKQRRIPRFSSSGAVNKILLRLNGSPFSRAEIDIVHTFGVGPKADVVSAQSCHRAGMDLLANRRELFLERRPLGLYDRISLGDEHRLLNSHRTKLIIAVSDLVKLQIQKYYSVGADRITVIPNGVDCLRMQSLRKEINRSDLRDQFGLGENDFVLLFVGNEFGRKGLLTIFDSLVSLHDKDVRLLVAGAGDIDSYSRRASALGISAFVKFLGGVANPEPLFIAADAFVLPSLYEPFGIVILEAMAAGMPVIASCGCGAMERMQHGRDAWLLTNPASSEELAAAVRKLKENPLLRAELSAAGQEQARKFSWDRIALQMLSVYKGVTG